MSKRDDGEPAFGSGNPEQGGHAGMSLRDWFAGQALAGFLANGSQRLIACALDDDENRPLIQDAKAKAAIVNEQLAIGCFALANAMLAERAK